MKISPEDFTQEIAEALLNYDKYLICLNKTLDEYAATLQSLIQKAVKAYEDRGDKKNGIALDKFVTVTITENGDEKPIINIYFNLYSSYVSAMHGKKLLTTKKSKSR